MNGVDLRCIPLPDDILKHKLAGNFEQALKEVDFKLSNYLPECMRARLEYEKQFLQADSLLEYPYTRDMAISLMKENIPDFEDKEWDDIQTSSGAVWIYINGAIHYHKLFFETIIKTRPEFACRLRNSSTVATRDERLNKLKENVAYMKENGGRKSELTIRASVKIKKEFEKVGKKVLVHLPIPSESRLCNEVTILNFSHKPIYAPASAEQRTVAFETILKEDEEFFVEYKYVNKLKYVEPSPELARVPSCDIEKEYLEEQKPHILFTPFMQTLLEEICADEENPIICARKIYDFITTKVMYSFVPEYAYLDNISEYLAKNLKGDCGVQAILFITLCRMKGIPARWQSGLHAMDVFTGSHDWAEFYVEPYGWMYADPSFGGSAYRSGDMPRWNYYFGNLDVYRMVANSKIQSQFIPEKSCLRADPIDNQRGEIEYEDEALMFHQFEEKQVCSPIIDLEN